MIPWGDNDRRPPSPANHAGLSQGQLYRQTIMLILSETTFDDASSWCAVLNVRGVIYRASFVASRLTVGLGPYKHPPRRPPWAGEYVRKWAESRVAALSPSWLAAHAAMYAELPSEAV